MYKTRLIFAALLAPIFLFGCASTNDIALAAKADSEFVYILDYEKISAVELATYTANRNVRTEWVNLPTKKITRAEYEKLLEGSK